MVWWMNREIAFRAWDPIRKRMMFGPSDGGPDSPTWILAVCATYDMNPMQFIGLRDKNGKAIYDGDILAVYPTFPKIYGKVATFKVVIGVGNWGIEAGWEHISGYECSTHIMSDDPVNYEVIGNIYENPELLEALHE